ncbi:hypothetical protein ACSBM8_00675 [Sphingomonas sp. ASY06-1R]|uniref:hypothetical protein n=1 Tax=Sphingomonas sp. ASY06-1R TaxID=3445771 RepID=UPI003FA2C710
MRIRDRQAALVAALMLVVAFGVLFLLPPATNDSEKAFRLVVAIAAFLAALLRWRRAIRPIDGDGGAA